MRFVRISEKGGSFCSCRIEGSVVGGAGLASRRAESAADRVVVVLETACVLGRLGGFLL